MSSAGRRPASSRRPNAAPESVTAAPSQRYGGLGCREPSLRFGPLEDDFQGRAHVEYRQLGRAGRADARAQLVSGGGVERTVRVADDAVVAGPLDGHQSTADLQRDEFGIAL